MTRPNTGKVKNAEEEKTGREERPVSLALCSRDT